MSDAKLTPMMQQYMDVRNSLPEDTQLMFRLGDFYEMFHRDAEEASRILGITLTKRHDTPMAGIPFHAAENYIGKFLASGKKVAICEQVETPQSGKLVKRELTRILTPGTLLEENQIQGSGSQFILSLCVEGKVLQASWLDLSTGEFFISSEKHPENLLPVISGLQPKEILIPETFRKKQIKHWENEPWISHLEALLSQKAVTELPDFQFELTAGKDAVLSALGVLNLEGFGVGSDNEAVGAAGALVQYVCETLCAKPENLESLQHYKSSENLLLDPATLRNLEIFRTASNTRIGSLCDAMDATVTAAGSRLLESYLAAPVMDLNEIHRRQQAVADFVAAPILSDKLHNLFCKINDITRILGRLQNRLCKPRELGGIRNSLDQLPEVVELLQQADNLSVSSYQHRINIQDALREKFSQVLEDELPANIQDGGLIKGGYDEELDRLRSLSKDNKSWLANLEREEQEKSGISNLKIKYNGAFGYFIEVTKANLSMVPDHYIRRQTLTNAERYYTEELKEKEKEILHAEEKSLAREEEIFRQLVADTLAEASTMKETARALAELDLFIGWAKIAREWNYCRPNIDESDVLEIDQGRHPVVEQSLKKEKGSLAGAHAFVPNDTQLSSSGEQIALITGPNMAGKSTYIRQVALITLMGQVGSWVPAKSCTIGMVDRIFSRVGASDELARGNSTFMVEMNETANILNNGTDRSLVILDEIGRGTSTYDGLSIAWSVIEHLHGSDHAGPRTLFATHYHELTKLEQILSRLKNYSVAVREWNDEIIFVRQVIPGAADRSYGIQVARLAGIPKSVIDRAKEILQQLEEDNNGKHQVEVGSIQANTKPIPKKKTPQKFSNPCQMELDL
jgi:DNA mismatch repair protein MutS